MKKIRYAFMMVLLGLCIAISAGCSSDKAKTQGDTSEIPDTEAAAKLQQEQSELLAQANTTLQEINQKIGTLNDKIRTKKGKLTEDLNHELDEFETLRASINQRMHQIKNVKMEEWENFKTTFQSDLSEMNSGIDKILAEL